MKTSTILALVVAIVIIGAGAWWYMQGSATPGGNTEINIDANNNTNNTPTNTTPDDTATSSQGTTTGANSGVSAGVGASVGTAKTVTVTYTSAGFSPRSVTINRGDTVRFVSEGPSMWVGADEHPSHEEYDGTSRSEHCTGGTSASFDQCKTGSTYSFTFNKTGTFGYHNHVTASHEGVVIVQ